MPYLLLVLVASLLVAAAPGSATSTASAATSLYSAYPSWSDLVAGARTALYPPLTRLSDPGTEEDPSYSGFWWYGLEQFSPKGSLALAMRVHIQNQPIRPTDVADVGFYDLRFGTGWHKIGETHAWNYQQGARLQWRPNSDEILWNDRADDGKSYVTRVYDVAAGQIVRTLPRPIYAVSPDGRYALTHDFDRARKPDVRYCDALYPEDCIPDQDCPPDEAAKAAPDCTGVWKMDLETGQAELIMSLARMASEADPAELLGFRKLWIMRESWNPSGTRILVFVKGGLNQAWTMAPDGSDARAVYDTPSHQTWLDDTTILEGHGFALYDDVSGDPSAGFLFENGPPNAHVTGIGTAGFGSALPNHDWVLADTYSIPRQYLFLYHRPTGTFVPLAALPSTAEDGINRVDLQARTSPDGRTVTIDSTYEGLGRQLYTLDIGYILDNPPTG
ncbi:MAG TPA: hypothetical protein VJT84_07690 [Gaiellaceae bacterium]|nr:hypothetical protein [Gaiellaceae bacterium]